MKFALIISAVAAINIGNLPEEHISKNCEGLGEDHAPAVSTKCADLTTGTPWSVQEWKDVRHTTDPNCKSNCCWKVTEGADAQHFGNTAANCVK